MRYDLPRLVSVSLFIVLTGCASAPSISTGPAVEFKPPTSVRERLVHAARVSLERTATHPPATLTPTITPTSTATPLPPTATPLPPMATSTALPPLPTPQVDPAAIIPQRLHIPAIALDVPIVTVGWTTTQQDGQAVSEWDVPNWRAAGWLNTSAVVGAPGNTVLIGHQDIDGRVFENLEYLREGDEVYLQTTTQMRRYIITLRLIVPEKNQPLEVRHENARWIGTSTDERVTLVTCWPRNDNTHRLILVALPAL